ncbi:MAG TPA: ubiquinone biosynthesis regulatory protein kinase UbiB [Acidiferrobacteraceae bacterium]|nr:ubiquinone biosynthesis regulatory protein kinase UbiB [Acidiferrobacteraceae bacterium]
MINPGRLARLLRITQVFVKHGLDDFIVAIHLLRPYQWILRLMPWRWRSRVRQARGVRLREALEELGPIFVKFGQMMSTRPDLLPDDIALELVKLQDQVPPFPGINARQVIEQAYGEALEKHFKTFDLTPVASASVAQVHFAILWDDREVAVKVLRPGIHKIIQRDLGLLYTLAELAQRYLPDGERLRPVEVVGEFAKTLDDELDLMREAANASVLRNNFHRSGMLLIPEVLWDHTRSTVMVMDRIHGIPIGNIDALREAGIDLKKLSHDGVIIFFTQAFRDGFFHADMHPGNIFVSAEGQYRAVDFGIMGTLSDVDKRYLAENFVAFFNRDYRAVAESHLNAGWVPADTKIEEFEAAIRTVCEPIFAKPLKEISFGRLLIRLFQTARRFNMEVQPQLVLLQKTLLNIEGLGRQLYPDLDLWQTAKPFLEKWTRDQLGAKAFFQGFVKNLPQWGKIAPELPGLFHDFLRRANSGEMSMTWRAEALEKMREETKRSYRRLYFAISGSALVVAGTVIAGLGQPMIWPFLGVSALAWGLGGLGLGLVLGGWPRK